MAAAGAVKDGLQQQLADAEQRAAGAERRASAAEAAREDAKVVASSCSLARSLARAMADCLPAGLGMLPTLLFAIV